MLRRKELELLGASKTPLVSFGDGCSTAVSLTVFLALEKRTPGGMVLTLDVTPVNAIVISLLHEGGANPQRRAERRETHRKVDLRPSPINDPDPHPSPPGQLAM